MAHTMNGQFDLFSQAIERNVLFGFSERKERNSLFGGSVFQIVDQTDVARQVVLEFDFSGRVLSASLQSKDVPSIKIFERTFQGTFRVYIENCNNLNHDGQLNYYYDYYQEVAEKRASLAELFCKQIQTFVQSLLPVPEEYAEIVQDILRYDWKQLESEKALLSNVYDSPLSVIPPEVRPDQNPAVGLIQITTGCWLYGLPRGPCAFCTSYVGQQYREKTLAEVSSHIEKVISFCGRSWGQVRKIFLLDADPLYTKLSSHAYLTCIRHRLVTVAAFECFVSTTCILSKTVMEWKALVALGLTKVYWGVESANDTVLKILKKPHTNEKLYQAAEVLCAAGLDVVVIIMSGIGHFADSKAHVVETGAFIRASRCGMVDISKIQILPGSGLHQQVVKGELPSVDATRIEEEHRSLIREISVQAPHCHVRGSYGHQFLS